MRAALLLLFSAACLPGQEPPAQLFGEREGRIVIEAEHAQDLGGYVIHEDDAASGGRYVSSGGQIVFQVLVHTRGRWRVFLRTKAHDDKGNSCFLFVDGKPIAAPEGIVHHHGVIQTTIGKWSWWTKWRESASVVVTVDLTPGLHRLAFAPREPQQLDKICLLLGPPDNGKRGDLQGGLTGLGPVETAHALTVAWPAERQLGKLAYQARGGQIGSVLMKLDKAAGRGALASEAESLRRELRAFIDTRKAAIEAAAARGDLLAAVDGVQVLAQLGKGLPEVRVLQREAKVWRKDERYLAGAAFFRLLAHSASGRPGEDFASLMDLYKKHYPRAPYLQPGSWWFAP